MTTQVHARKAERAGFGASDIALIAVFAALMAVLAIIPPIFTVGAIPFAIQVIAVLLTPLVLGPLRGGCACALYLLVGIAGLPVFAGGHSGPAAIIGPTGGYLLGFVVQGFIVGAVAAVALRRRPNRRALPWLLIACAILGVVIIHLCGVIFFMTTLHMTLTRALITTAPFFPWDCLKGVIAGFLAVAVFTAFPALMPARKA
ncbi:biotin transporter BioY [Propionibacterium sp.]|uniref:biotin transporter BioY n=1 Tax=Propionibacterium sp. TaxID=1977903 RepID=UPI0039ED17B3